MRQIRHINVNELCKLISSKYVADMNVSIKRIWASDCSHQHNPKEIKIDGGGVLTIEYEMDT